MILTAFVRILIGKVVAVWDTVTLAVYGDTLTIVPTGELSSWVTLPWTTDNVCGRVGEGVEARF